MQYQNTIEALSDNNLVAARDMLLTDIMEQTAERASWDSRYYITDRMIQESIPLDHARSKLISYFGMENLRDRYFLKDEQGNILENPQTFFARVSTGMARGDQTFAHQLYEIISRQWFIPATPVLMNIGTKKGLPISCFLNTVPDTLEGIFDLYRENAFLSKYGEQT